MPETGEPSSPYPAILLFGPPGSGKGTQGRILASIPGFFHSATGDIFRSLDLQSEAGRVAWEYTSRGELVPDEFTIGVWKQYIRGMEMINQFHPEAECLILDGVPRSANQARLLESTIDVRRIIHLVADEEKLVERLKRRALKENRIDDANDEVIRHRLHVYERDTKPLLDFYPEAKIFKVDAMMSQVRVLRELLKIISPIKDELDEASESIQAPHETRGSKDEPAHIAAIVGK